MTLSHEIRIAILAKEGNLSAGNFYPLCKARGSNNSAAQRAVRYLRDAGVLRQCGVKDGFALYERVAGVEVPVIARKERVQKFHPNDNWWNKTKADPQYIATCMLEEAMSVSNGWRV